MSAVNTKISMTPLNSTNISEIDNATHGISSQVPVKTSFVNRARHSWLTFVISLIVIAVILTAVGVAVVSFVIVRQTTISTSTTTTTTTTISAATAITCFAIPSSRPSNAWFVVGSMSFARIYHSSTLISQDNSVLMAGGSNGGTLISTEKYIPSTGCFQAMGNMPRARYWHTADQLSALSGYVLISGGYGITGALIYADLFDPMTSNTLTISLSAARYRHTSTILSSSQLVLIGGSNQTNALNTGDQLYAGSSTSFSTVTSTIPTAVVGHTATQLGNTSGIVLVAGGTDGGSGFFTSAALYHGPSNTFLSLGSGVSLSPGRSYHTATYLPPPINKVLFVGGAAYYVTYGTMLLFDVITLSFSTLTSTLATPRYYHTATLLPTGKILIAGGYSAGALGACELIDPSNNYSSTPAAVLHTSRYYHTATFIPDNNNGTILVCGGLTGTGSPYLNSCELYYI